MKTGRGRTSTLEGTILKKSAFSLFPQIIADMPGPLALPRAVAASCLCASAAAYVGVGVRLLPVSSRPVHMSAVLHVYEPESSSELCSYLERRRGAMPSPFEEAPKLSYSIALELDESLDGETLPLSDGARASGLTIIISEAEDMDAMQACLSALGEPEGATLEPRDFDGDRLTGFCGSADGAAPPAVTLINGESVAGFQAAPSNLQAVLDVTAILADELEEHFEFRVTGGPGLLPVVFGGRAPDGCIVGVLGMR